MDQNIRRLIDACNAVMETADSTGCTEDLTVVSADALEDLRRLIYEIRHQPIEAKDRDGEVIGTVTPPPEGWNIH